METKNEITKVEQSPLMPIISAASTNGEVDADKLLKLLEANRQWDADQARKAFAADFTAVQSKIEAVVKTAVNPQTKSKYAKLEGVIEMAKPLYTECGFSVIFYEGTATAPDNVRVCADVLHGEGHKETYHYDVPLGGVGIKGVVNMTKIHGKATSVTYGRRYLLCMIWNIPTQDDDGNPPAGDPNAIPEPSKKAEKVLEAICKKMLDSVPDGLTLVDSRVDEVLFAKEGRYPEDMSKAGATASWLIGLLNKGNSWHTVTKEAGL